MSTVSVSEARARFSEVLEQSRLEAVILARHGRPEAVVVSPEQYERMRDALEELEDVRAFDEALAEEGENIPWAQAKADLGWG
ncbi:type II toxin-antitoxin system Phd/YefM family antitoxin [Rathayibacter caricis DSM 15933]|jgi:prevent-host-death family protein|uniref:Antitoxin n=1 Tax=Rathayibacter caricis DSM 15933 TaxID=1328867 RepID=A0A2T4UQC9_9MICO|nr:MULTISPECIES: type II toxin-antitoxin system Phd/YefM family antitoxin [Rathayibacter]KQQ20695.1 prevent-host-death family protein [Rathayibacter sp. Leaf299]MCJ1697382.1 type II toxin-antitoxin system Phd/YefM family antitoxin [Rathayibacter caricis]PTL71733.1 type II toxin-antitoxin system Phd/YefM family antitoxin [Rathayibacter caricis DSM 15933]